MFIKLNLGSFRLFTDRPGYSDEKRAFKNTLDFIVARGSVVVKALCYKPEGRGFDSR
jgi:hypothetical protein